jgi:hypothetical protein
MMASVGGLLAAYAAPRSPPPDEKYVALLGNAKFLENQKIAIKLSEPAFRKWLPAKSIEIILKATRTIQHAGDQFVKASESADPLRLFSLGPVFDSYASAIRSLREKRLPHSLDTWKVVDFEAVAAVVGGFRASYAKELRAEIERTRTRLQNRIDAKALVKNLERHKELAAISATVLTALKHIDDELPHLTSPHNQVPDNTHIVLGGVASHLRSEGFDGFAAPYLSAKAAITASTLNAGSISIFGLSIPGVAMQLLLPLFVLGIAVDVNATLRKAIRWADTALPATAVNTHVQLFPWIPILSLSWNCHQSAYARIIAAIAAGIQFVPAALLFPLAVMRVNGYNAWFISVSAVAGISIAQGYTIKLLQRLAASGRNEAMYDMAWNEQASDLVASHFERIDNAWSTAITVSAAISTFFVAYLFVPPILLKDRTSLSESQRTRGALQVVYDQRFHEHRDTFVKWCTLTCSAYDSLIFLSQNLPESHPALALAEAILNEEPLARYPYALSNIKDIVQESRARFVELDRDDLKDAVEILYRKNLNPLPARLRAIAQALARQPLSDAVMETVSPYVKRATISGPLAMPITYREFVEIGGFAYLLTKLPDQSNVTAFIKFMEDNGVSKIAGFDAFYDALSQFDSALGSLKLKLAGVDIDRQIARSVAPWFIVTLLALILLRLILAREALRTLNEMKSASTLLSASTSSFLNFEPHSARNKILLGGIMRMMPPCLVLGLIASTPSPSGAVLDWALAAAIAGVALSLLIVGIRMELLITPVPDTATENNKSA